MKITANRWPAQWGGKAWGGSDHGPRGGLLTWTFSESELLAVYLALPDEAAVLRILGATTRSDRIVDRALQLLRGAGLANFNRETRRWERTQS